MRIVGVDPGSRFVGFGVIEMKGQAYSCLDCGVIRAIHLKRLDEKLLCIFQALQALLCKHKPDAVAVEDVFFGRKKNPRGILLLGQARGVVLLAAALEKIPVFEYTPSRIKRAVGAGGGGSKAAVTRMVKTLLELPKQQMRADAYDGLAIALCHAHTVLGFRQPGAQNTSSQTTLSKATLSKTTLSKATFSSFAERLKKSYVAPREVR
ncbi:MAG: crossover junction endodeoxyribonuclease RuvC [Cystobacterineae bacterium]|nr:crossover junction endodeoxyribonuclease RuvC [Cystobacterineae bacterium]